MIVTFYKLFLTFNSILPMIIVYLAKEFSLQFSKLEFLGFCIIFIVVTIFLNWIVIQMSKWLSDDCINSGVKSVNLANNDFLPTYLGYFFVALSIPNNITMILTYFIIFVFTYVSQTLYFNPIFLCFGYKFYHVEIANGVKHLIISKRNIKNIDGLSFNNLKRVNNFTFIEFGGDENE